MATSHQLATSSCCDSLDLGDHELRNGVDQLHHAGAAVKYLLGCFGIGIDHFSKIMAGTEVFAGSIEDDDLDVFINGNSRKHFDHLLNHLLRERIDFPWIVQGQSSDGTVDMELDLAVCAHVLLL